MFIADSLLNIFDNNVNCVQTNYILVALANQFINEYFDINAKIFIILYFCYIPVQNDKILKHHTKIVSTYSSDFYSVLLLVLFAFQTSHPIVPNNFLLFSVRLLCQNLQFHHIKQL